jgi:alpha-L-rhamnosidase
VKHGATTIWERWNGWTPEVGVHPDAGMNSFNHYSLGSCGRWLFESVAGIARDPARAGFERVIMHPEPTQTLTSAKAKFRSLRGAIESAWSADTKGYNHTITVPGRVVARVFVPAKSADAVNESGKPVSGVTGVRVLRAQDKGVVLEVESGTYTFSVARDGAQK